MINHLRLIGKLRRFRRDQENWQPGDLAECITDGWWNQGRPDKPFSGLEAGDRMVVHLVIPRFHPQLGRYTSLNFRRFPRAVFDATGFRKIVPQADHQIAADAAFIDDLRRRPVELPPVPHEREVA